MYLFFYIFYQTNSGDVIVGHFVLLMSINQPASLVAISIENTLQTLLFFSVIFFLRVIFFKLNNKLNKTVFIRSTLKSIISNRRFYYYLSICL